MTAPTLADAERAIAYAQENLRLAAQAGGDAERSGRYQQAGAALSSAGRIVSGLAAATAPPAPPRGLPLSFGGVAAARPLLAIAWDVFKVAAGEDAAAWDMARASAEIRPEERARLTAPRHCVALSTAWFPWLPEGMPAWPRPGGCVHGVPGRDALDLGGSPGRGPAGAAHRRDARAAGQRVAADLQRG
jgi:hypothetical protein